LHTSNRNRAFAHIQLAETLWGNSPLVFFEAADRAAAEKRALLLGKHIAQILALLHLANFDFAVIATR
jgi:hypothetical protein